MEGISSGIPRVFDELAREKRDPPQFLDQGIRFAVKLSQGADQRSTRQREPVMVPQGTHLHCVARALAAGQPSSAHELAQHSGLTPSQVQRSLRTLESQYHLIKKRGRGRRTTYTLGADFTSG